MGLSLRITATSMFFDPESTTCNKKNYIICMITMLLMRIGEVSRKKMYEKVFIMPARDKNVFVFKI